MPRQLLLLLLLAVAPALAHGDVLPDFSFDPDALIVTSELTIAERREVTTLHVTPTGRLILKPGAEIVILDRPIDAKADPLQHGHGLLVEGTIHAAGTAKTPFVRAGVEPRAGAATLTLAEPPEGWLVGDMLLVTHSRQPREGEADVDNNEYAKIAALEGSTVTLVEPLKHDHPAARNLDMQVMAMPHIANMTRDIVIRSENPRGVRGHAMLTMGADVDVRNVAFLDLGRTTAEPLDNATFNANGSLKSIGKNQMGRYGGPHFHHLHGPHMPQPGGFQFTLSGCVVDGGDAWRDMRPKWGITIHNSHFGLIEGNIATRLYGWGVGNEFGNETGNMIRGNLVGRIASNYSQRLDTDPDQVRGSFGYWLRGVDNDVVGNACFGPTTRAFFLGNLESAQPPEARVAPQVQGAMKHVPVDVFKQGVRRFDSNEAYGCAVGFETWYIGCKSDATKWFGDDQPVSRIANLTIWNCAWGVSNYPTENVWYENLTGYGDVEAFRQGRGNAFWASSDYPAAGGRIVNPHIEGYMAGIIPSSLARGPEPFVIEGGDIKCWWDLVMQTVFVTGDPHAIPPREVRVKGVKLSKPPFDPPRQVSGLTWFAVKMEGIPGRNNGNTMVEDKLLLEDLDGVAGENLRVYYLEQAADFQPLPDVPGGRAGSPEPGLTNAQLWAKRSMAFAGAVAPPTAVKRDGFQGLVETLGEPP